MYVQPDLTISVIVPIHSGANTFVQCLGSLLQAIKSPHEVIVVADGPAPKLIHLARQFGLKVVPLSQPGGPARARNRGAAEARGDILFFVDSDVMVPPDIMPRLIAEFEQDPHLAALIGSYDDRPSAANFLSQYRNLLHHYVHQNSTTTVDTFWAGCGAVRRRPFMAVGGFDESYTQPSVEDIELGYRLTAAGYSIRIAKSLQVKHLKQWQARAVVHTDFWRRALPWTRLLLRRQRFENNLNIDRQGRLSVGLIYTIILLLPIVYFWPVALAAIGFMALLLLIFNGHFYHFLIQKRGFWFAATAVPWHWLYFLYSGFAFMVGNGQHYYALAQHWLFGVWQSTLQPDKSSVPVREKSMQ